jgi:hypothetical protein
VQSWRLVFEGAEDHVVGTAHRCLVVNEEGEWRGTVQKVGEGYKGGLGLGGGSVQTQETGDEVCSVDIADIRSVEGVGFQDVGQCLLGWRGRV